MGDTGDLTDDMVVFWMAEMAQGEEEINPDGEDAVAPVPVSKQPRLNKDVYENTTDFFPAIRHVLLRKSHLHYPSRMTRIILKRLLLSSRTIVLLSFHCFISFGYPGNQDVCHPGHVESFSLIPEHEE